MATPHIESNKEDISNLVLMPGDPKRAKHIAETFLEDYELVNNVRGMTAYTGTYKGKRITVFPSGMGIPSMGIYSYELMKFYDVDVIIRIGTMGSYSNELKVRDICVSEDCYSTSNYGVELNGRKEEIVKCSQDVLNAVKNNISKVDTSIKFGRVHCTETFYNVIDINKLCEEQKVLGVEMETYALYSNANELGKKALSMFTVTDHLITKEALPSSERESNVDAMVLLALETIISL